MSSGLPFAARPTAVLRSLLALLMALMALMAPAWASCSRDIVLPVGQPVLRPPSEAQRAPAAEPPASLLHQRVLEAGARLGCRFVFPRVPRPRLQAMLLNGDADLMLPAARDASRDAVAHFVPLTVMRPALLMRRGDPRRPASLDALAAASDLQGLMVRGQAWGGALDQALKQQPQRLQQVADVATVVRMLAAGRADFSVSEAAVLDGLNGQPDLQAALAQLEIRPLPGLGAVEVGGYVSRALPAADQALMLRLMADEGVRAAMRAPLPPSPPKPGGPGS